MTVRCIRPLGDKDRLDHVLARSLLPLWMATRKKLDREIRFHRRKARQEEKNINRNRR